LHYVLLRPGCGRAAENVKAARCVVQALRAQQGLHDLR